MCDWNCPDNKKHWLWAIIDKMWECPQHTFQILSKDPMGYIYYDFPHNVWLGASHDGTDNTLDTARDLVYYNASYTGVKFVSYEPLLAEPTGEDRDAIMLLDWIIIGADSRRGAALPDFAWVDRMVAEARLYNVPVWIKDLHGEQWYTERIQEFPDAHQAS